MHFPKNIFSYGYIPVSIDDPNYRKEESRQDYLKFNRCACSNCEPEAAKEIHKSAHLITKHNFEDILKDPSAFTIDIPDFVRTKKKRHTNKKYESRFGEDVVNQITRDLVAHFSAFYLDLMGPEAEMKAEDFFGTVQAREVAKAFKEINEPGLIAKLIGGEWFENQLTTIFQYIEMYKQTDWFKQQVFDVEKEKRETENEKKEKLQKKAQDVEKKQKANEKKESDRLAKRAEDAIALERFKQIRAAEAEGKQANGEVPIVSSSSNLQPKQKRIRLSLEERKERDGIRLAEKVAKRAENATALEHFKNIRAAEAKEKVLQVNEQGKEIRK